MAALAAIACVLSPASQQIAGFAGLRPPISPGWNNATFHEKFASRDFSQ
jgi:hypothetical protein